MSDSSVPSNPSTIIPDLDPAIERLILRCLERDPARRPPSAVAVATALPGGDPLAAALAAGETPSPEMVAAAGEEGSLSPAVGAACLAAIAIALIAVVWMSHKTTLLGYVTMDKGPEALADRARTIARELGYTARPADSAYGYTVDEDYLQYIQSHDRSVGRWEVIRAGRPSAMWFWPETLIGWSRLVMGRMHDPLVGRDAVIGVVGGTSWACGVHLATLMPTWFGFPLPLPIDGRDFTLAAWDRTWSWTLLLGPRQALGQIVSGLGFSVATGLTQLLFLVVLASC